MKFHHENPSSQTLSGLLQQKQSMPNDWNMSTFCAGLGLVAGTALLCAVQAVKK
jgi:hypothetical protein